MYINTLNIIPDSAPVGSAPKCRREAQKPHIKKEITLDAIASGVIRISGFFADVHITEQIISSIMQDIAPQLVPYRHAGRIDICRDTFFLDFFEFFIKISFVLLIQLYVEYLQDRIII